MPDLDLLRELAPPVEPPPHRTFTPPPPRRDRRPLLIASPFAVGAVILALVLLAPRGQTFAEAAIRAAEAGPRLVVEGYQLTRVDEWDAGTGEMTFEGNERSRLELRWSPADDGTKDLERVATARVTGRQAFVGRYPGTTDYTARWRDGDAFVSARGDAATPEAFLETLERIRQVSAVQWLKTLPASAVEPKALAKATDEMLEGIKLPPGFVAPPAGDATRDRYQLGAKVAGAIVCGWIERWLAGDPEAAKALATSREWPLLRQMDAEGDYPEVVRQYADAINGTGEVPGGMKGLSVEATYKDAFGC